ncbi:hypothetical protein HDF16_003368 [Granulicella aggregans]|uniref:Uncharacterized protein n=1 Tax=Granulicella aggregans TaxID=474949 RepID=A0A7W8E4W3_9BACT|nr:hypothetical protein [Granulicella aggregans]MBB5058654.1 hypothetical protein [Granulicella aggregans]
MKLTPGANLPAARRILSSVNCFRGVALLLVVASLNLVATPASIAQPIDDPLALIKVAVRTELDADDNDHSRWRYRDEQHELGTVSIVVQTDFGSVKRLISRSGKPLSTEEAAQEEERLNRFVHDSSKIAKQRKDGAADDKSARELLEMLPEAFTWSIEAENPSVVRLHFEPRPDFHPPTLQSRALAAMNGSVVVDRSQHRIITISGRLTQDVTFGFGLFGRLLRGGTFQVERRQLAPRLWQITETHVHIDGKALLFKSIGQQQDEVQTDYTPVPHGTTLEQAAVLSRP